MLNKTELESFIRSSIRNLTPYSSARNESEIETTNRLIQLDANESPWNGVGPSTSEAYHRYPEPQPIELKEKLARYLSTGEENILLTRGIDEGLDVFFRTFCEPGVSKVLTVTPTYGYYKVLANIHGTPLEGIPFDEDKLPIEAVLEKVDVATKALILCNPNNPTGGIVEPRIILALLERLGGRCLVLIDEAYIDFTESKSFLPHLANYPEVVIMRTFSKAWGLAGARLGLTLAHPKLVGAMQKVLAPYPLPRHSASILRDVLSPKGIDALRDRVERINTLRDELAIQLAQFPWIEKVYPSVTNFLLVKVPNPDACVSFLRSRGIVIRNRKADVPGCVRITVGTREENQILLREMTEMVR